MDSYRRSYDMLQKCATQNCATQNWFVINVEKKRRTRGNFVRNADRVFQPSRDLAGVNVQPSYKTSFFKFRLVIWIEPLRPESYKRMEIYAPSLPLPLGRFFLGNTKSTFGTPQVCHQSFCENSPTSVAGEKGDGSSSHVPFPAADSLCNYLLFSIFCVFCALLWLNSSAKERSQPQFTQRTRLEALVYVLWKIFCFPGFGTLLSKSEISNRKCLSSSDSGCETLIQLVSNGWKFDNIPSSSPHTKHRFSGFASHVESRHFCSYIQS